MKNSAKITITVRPRRFRWSSSMPSSPSQFEEQLVLCGPGPDEEASAWDVLQEVIDIVPSRSADFAFLRTRLQPDDSAVTGEMPIGQQIVRTAGPGGAELWEFPVSFDPPGCNTFDSDYEVKVLVISFTVLIDPSSRAKWWTVWLRSSRDIPKLTAVLRRLMPHIRVKPDLRAVDSVPAQTPVKTARRLSANHPLPPNHPLNHGAVVTFRSKPTDPSQS